MTVNMSNLLKKKWEWVERERLGWGIRIITVPYAQERLSTLRNAWLKSKKNIVPTAFGRCHFH